MRITLAQLEALVWVSRLGSVSGAAEHLHLTQPTVSLRIRDLADAVGRPVLEKKGRSMRLTPEGETMLEHALVIVGELDKIRDRGRPEQVSGTIRVGISEAIAMAGLPRIVELLRTRHPMLRLDLAIGTSGDLERELLAGHADFALGINLYDDPRLRILPLGVQGATWLAAGTVRLPSVVRPSDIGNVPVLTNPSPSPMYQQTVDWFRTAGLSPRHISISNSITVIAHLVASGVGVAILPRRLIEHQAARGEVVALDADPPIGKAHMCAAYRLDDSRPAIEAVLGVARQVIDELNWLEPAVQRRGGREALGGR